jgi:hypothetical protein
MGGNWMKVALSTMMVFKSSARSVTIQSSFRGNIAVSLDTRDLLLKPPKGQYDPDVRKRLLHLIHRRLEKHILCSFNPEKLPRNPYYVPVLAGLQHIRRSRRSGRDLGRHKTLQGRREIYVRGSLLLDGLQRRTLLSRNDGVKFAVNFACFSMKTTLKNAQDAGIFEGAD